MPGPARSPLTLPLLVAFYAAMAGAAGFIAWAFDVPSLWHLPAPEAPLPEWAALAAGVGLGLAAHALGLWARSRLAWARTFYDRLAELIGPAGTLQVVAAALLSGVAEELLFRGALMPLIGLVPQALVFGLLHLGPGRAFRFWPLYAAVMGLALGGLYQLGGTLAAPILAHFTVNYFGLSAVARRTA